MTWTKAEFIKGYCERSGISYASMMKYNRMAVPCSCGDHFCHGWQMVNVKDESLGPAVFKPAWWCRPVLWRIRLFIEKTFWGKI
jgi:hypothetical protein